MIVHEVPFNWELRSADGEAMGEGRSKGLHLSDIIRYMRECNGERFRNGPGGENWMVWGFIWERLVPHILAGYFGMQRPLRIMQGEQVLNGIAMTPDAINTEDGRLEEYKATWKSQKRLPEGSTPEELIDCLETHFHFWLWQIKAYSYAVGTTQARLVVAFLSFPPRFRCIELDFTEQELVANWEMIRANAVALVRGGDE